MSNSHRHKHTKFKVPLLVGKGELTFVGFGGGGGRFDNHLTGADLALDSPEYSAAKAFFSHSPQPTICRAKSK